MKLQSPCRWRRSSRLCG